MKALKTYLNYQLVPEIRIKNLDPSLLHFDVVIAVMDLPTSFFLATKSELKQKGYSGTGLSFHMMTEVSVICPAANRDVFCIVLYGDIDIAILGLGKSSDGVWFDWLDIGGLEEVEAQVAANSKNEVLPDDFKREMVKNWDTQNNKG